MNDWELGIGIAPKIFVHKNFILGAIGNWELDSRLKYFWAQKYFGLELGATQKFLLRCQLLRRLGIGNCSLRNKS
jgi:hypothetical protein